MKKITIITATASILAIQTFAASPRFGTLEVTTTPDSATVILNDITEQEVTPYTNDKMVLGKHNVTLKPIKPIFKSAKYEVSIDLDETEKIEHDFLYRNKSFLNENLSVAPGYLQFELGYAYQHRNGSYQTGTKTETNDENVTTVVNTGEDVSYANDNLGKQYMMPIILRVGLPMNIELHARLPYASIGKDNAEKAFSRMDITAGFKYTHRPINSAINVDFKFANGDQNEVGHTTNAYSIAADLITLQSFYGAEFLGQLGYEYNFSDIDNNQIKLGDIVTADIQAGYLLGPVLPFLSINGNYQLEKDSAGTVLDSVSFRAGLEIGAIFDVTNSFTIQAGIPFSVMGDKTEKYIGFNLSAALSFDLIGKKSESRPVTQGEYTPSFSYDSTAAKNAEAALIFDRSEVTNAEYKEFCDRTRTTYPIDPGFPEIEDYFRNPEYKDYPVVNVSYANAMAYAQWKNKRLPTAEEWKKEFSTSSVAPKSIVNSTDKPQAVTSINQGNTLNHILGNVSEWVVEEGVGESASTAFHAGCSYNMPSERCTNPDRLVDMASSKGAKFIGFRCVTELK
ncbi:MAG: formylglycine-generating enzyme family protein [Fibrobacterales bacterium]